VRVALALSALLVACTSPRNETSSSTQPVACAVDATGVDAREVVEARFGATLARTTWTARGNHHPSARFVLRRGAQSLDLGEGAAAVLTSDGAAVVRLEGVLDRFDARTCATTIARNALPDLAVSPDGRTLAFVQTFGEGTALQLHNGSMRRLASAYAEADRPLFVDDRTLVFVGAARPGISTFHRISLDDELPVPLAIEGIPATRDGYEVSNGRVRFHDGETFKCGVVR
jgi:hypothetical protein